MKSVHANSLYQIHNRIASFQDNLHNEPYGSYTYKALFLGYGIRLGTQEIARYDWNDEALDRCAYVVKELANPNINTKEILDIVHSLPVKIVHYYYPMYFH